MLPGIKQGDLPLVDLVGHRCAGSRPEGPGPDIVRIDLTEDPGGIFGVLLCHLLAAKAGHPVFRYLKAGFHGLFTPFNMALRRYSFFDLLEQGIISGFKAQVEPVETGCADGLQILN